MQDPEIRGMIGDPDLCEPGPRPLVGKDRFLPGNPHATETTPAVIPPIDCFSEVCLSRPLFPQPHPSPCRDLVPGDGQSWKRVRVAEGTDRIPLGLKVRESQQCH